MTHLPQPPGADLLDIVFANRNQAYGAYQLRRTYPEALARALGGSIILIGTFFFAVNLLSGREKETALNSDSGMTVFTHMKDPKPIPKPVLSKAATSPARHQRQFVPTLVVPNDQAPELDNKTTQAELIQSNADIGTSDQAGTHEGPPDLTQFVSSGLGPGDGSGTTSGDPTVYDMSGVHKSPYFPGGEQELLVYLSKHIRYPEAARIAGISSQVVVSFVVNTDGSISDIAVLKDPGAGCGNEVLRVVTGMPRWVPGESNGHPVRVRFYLPVRFELK